MKSKDLFGSLKNQLFAKWVACRLISDKKSTQYGMYFSYPIYISIVLLGIFLKNPFILLIAAFIAFLGIKLPLHPFDYIYNITLVRLIGTKRIPGRGSELQVNSFIALIFNLIVITFIFLKVPINYTMLGVIYALISISLIGVFLFKD